MTNGNLDKLISIDNLIDVLADVANWHDIDNGHGLRTAVTALAIGKRLNGGNGLNEEKLKLLDYAARIHDLGRIAIDDEIIAKVGNLTTGQRAQMEVHPEIGYRFLYRSNLPKEITETILYHHEHFDGSGYPKGLIGLDIPLFARIVAIADMWDALTNNRPYRIAMDFSAALNTMNVNRDWFDPKLFELFLSVLKDGKNDKAI